MENHPHTHGAHDHPGQEPDPLGGLLDLDAEVLHDYLDEVMNWVQQLTSSAPRRRILDLGCGTGTGALALALRFDDSDIVAVDRSQAMLATVADRAIARGVGDRVSTAEVDLSSRWPDGAPADLIWAASSLHELPDPDFVLANAHHGLNPEGMIAVAEMDAPPKFLPEDIGMGRPGLESRMQAILDRIQMGWGPHPDWGPHLTAAGFTAVEKRTFTIDLPAPQPAATGRYARAYFLQIRPLLAPRLSAEDLASLDTLLSEDGPGALLHREDLTVKASRTAWVARRP